MVKRRKELYPEDQEKVDRFVSTGYNDVERKPFRPLILLGFLLIVLTLLSGISYLIAWINEAV